MFKITSIVVIFLLFSSCAKKEVSIDQTDNPEITSQILFTDSYGYTIHRFYDGSGTAHYYVTPKGSTISLTNEKQEEIQTITK